MLHEISFKSFNERDEVQGWVYVPACEPKGIIQLIHGFGEHSRRYFHMIVAFMDAGFIVAADDHVGHGKTAIVNNTWGDWGHKGAHTMMEDEHILTGIVKEMYPSVVEIVNAYKNGTEFNIKMDEDGLIFEGNSNTQLTWMDAKIGEIIPTPRYGKPVEINALWYNALKITEILSNIVNEEFDDTLSRKVEESFRKFYAKEGLYDIK